MHSHGFNTRKLQRVNEFCYELGASTWHFSIQTLKTMFNSWALFSIRFGHFLLHTKKDRILMAVIFRYLVCPFSSLSLLCPIPFSSTKKKRWQQYRQKGEQHTHTKTWCIDPLNVTRSGDNVYQPVLLSIQYGAIIAITRYNSYH